MEIQSFECIENFSGVKRARGGMDVNGGKKGKAGVGVEGLGYWEILVDESLESSLHKPGTPTCVRGAPPYRGVCATPRASKNRLFSTRYKKTV